jgi:hypothetical protein
LHEVTVTKEDVAIFDQKKKRDIMYQDGMMNPDEYTKKLRKNFHLLTKDNPEYAKNLRDVIILIDANNNIIRE